MPMFDFSCKECSKDFEKLVRSSEDYVCKHCNSKNVEKKTNATGFVLKGVGNYKSGNYILKK